jgi:predicted dehydrogenase
MIEKKIRIGLIGLGHLGKIHLKCLQLLPDIFDIVGIHDVNANLVEEVSSKFGIQGFTNLDDLLQLCEAIDIVSTTSTHYEIARKGLELGLHLFIEKPVTATVEEAQALLALAAEQQQVIQVGHVERFNPAYLAIDNIQINPLFIESHRLATFNMRGTDVSVVLDLMIHDLDLILHLVNSPVISVAASGVCVVSNTADISNARIEFENGCVANVTASRLSMKQMRKMRIFQSDAYVSLDFLEKSSQIIKLSDAPENTEHSNHFVIDTAKGPKQISIEAPQIQEVNAIQEELSAFGQSIVQGTSAMVTLAAGVAAVELAHQIEGLIMEKQATLTSKL